MEIADLRDAILWTGRARRVHWDVVKMKNGGLSILPCNRFIDVGTWKWKVFEQCVVEAIS